MTTATDSQTIAKVQAILRHLSNAPLDEEWPTITPAEWLIEGINECLELLGVREGP